MEKINNTEGKSLDSLDIEERAGMKLLSFKNIKRYLIVSAIIIGIIVIYNLINNYISSPIMGGPPGMGAPPVLSLESASSIITSTITQPPGGGGNPSSMFDLWPMWGQFSVPTILGVIICIIVFIIFTLFIIYMHRKREKSLNLVLITIIGIILIIGTNLIQGWNSLESSIGGTTEIYWDAISITNLFDFISNYESLQATLSVHAQTQPPGAVILIYLLYLVFGSSGLIAIGLCIITTIFSVYFLNGILKRIFDKDLSKYSVFLFILLPAIQVYYLANIYALLAIFILGAVYYYFHSNRIISIIGTLACTFLASFTTFLFFYVILFFFIFELLHARKDGLFTRSYLKEFGILKVMRNLLKGMQTLILVCLGLIAIYGSFLIFMNFNYINAFLFALNKSGTSSVLSYILTRIQNILDILIFFGPILIVLCYQGMKYLKKQASKGDGLASRTYLMVISALLALGLMFLAGSPPKGETARICMFILPFLLIPVAVCLKEEKYARKEKLKLLALVFIQTLVMQSFFTFIW